ncbi:hypothetical protein L596_027212 [Steinernema carpocapsae]|uniref:Uncharacterized protein n=1 Tax=Steinernema carpocapsae TaxID=34508 RepID=A0A4U5M3T3_STECR|nr:hypothetical protein L596_027212 [Steinernema carpocapsae]
MRLKRVSSQINKVLMPEHKIFPPIPGPTAEPHVRIWDVVVLGYILLYIISFLAGFAFIQNWWLCALLYISGALSVMRWRFSADFQTPTGIFFFASLIVALFSMMIPIATKLTNCEADF